MSIRADRRLKGEGLGHEAPRTDHPHPSYDLEVSDPDTALEEALRPYIDIDQNEP
ncbi:MAG TPA: hypothetical protein VEB69_03755 [Acidimicrobiia bacterium]|nr:hypothetical protein [Acidimicrobiia bacterium]